MSQALVQRQVLQVEVLQFSLGLHIQYVSCISEGFARHQTYRNVVLLLLVTISIDNINPLFAYFHHLLVPSLLLIFRHSLHTNRGLLFLRSPSHRGWHFQVSRRRR